MNPGRICCTITIDAGKLLGNLGTIPARAVGPPVAAPMITTDLGANIFWLMSSVASWVRCIIPCLSARSPMGGRMNSGVTRLRRLRPSLGEAYLSPATLMWRPSVATITAPYSSVRAIFTPAASILEAISLSARLSMRPRVVTTA